jgi:hypothetical protein
VERQKIENFCREKDKMCGIFAVFGVAGTGADFRERAVALSKR